MLDKVDLDRADYRPGKVCADQKIPMHIKHILENTCRMYYM